MRESQRQFEEEVFPAELEEIRRRREELGLDAEGLVGGPSVDLGLKGIAFSGGGIRAATFCLGALAAASRAGLLARADYISTVSGGGFIGSCLSSVLNDPDKEPEGERFPFHHVLGTQEPAAYRHLRNGSNYLAPRGFLNKVRIPVLVLRGIILNFLLFLPILMGAVLLTEVVYEIGTRSPIEFDHLPLLAVGAFFALIVAFPIVARLQRRWLGWERRDFYGRLLASAFVLALVLIVVLPAKLYLIRTAGTWETFRGVAASELNSFFEPSDYWKWMLLIGAVAVLLAAGKASEVVAKLWGRLLLYLIGLIAPALLLLIFIVLCVYELDSPYLDMSLAEGLDESTLSAPLRSELARRGVELGPKAEVIVDVPGKAWTIEDGDDAHRIAARGTVLRIETLDLWDGEDDWIFFAVLLAILLFNVVFMDVNLTSPHSFYRDRLSRVFLFRVSADDEIETNDAQKMSTLNAPKTKAPYHLINTALNLHGSRNPNLRGRNADFFVLSKRYAGSMQTGYCETDSLEEIDTHLNLGTAMAVSGAAAAPNMGVTTERSLVFLMTLLNIRLGYWLPNPEYVRSTSFGRRLLLRRGAGPLKVISESIGGVHARGAHVNVSDGGHLENLAVYELLRRRCELIVSIDAGRDPEHQFPSLIRLIRFAKLDMGIQIDIDLSDLALDENGFCSKHWAVGKIRYGDDQVGHLLYVKASMTGDENLYVREYGKMNPTFPHESTANQFFTEEQFEACRALGYHAASRAIAEHATLAGLPPDESD